jgi:hypothetical protein
MATTASTEISTTTIRRTVETTTLLVDRPADYAALTRRFRLVRYELPERARQLARLHQTQAQRQLGARLYGQVHNGLRDQLDYPYKSFKYDTLDDAERKQWVVYVLYPREVEPQRLTLRFLDDAPLTWREVGFADLDLHLLLKLLHIAYFRGERASGRFIGQDRCYMYAKQQRADRHHICLEVELIGDIGNLPELRTQTFRVRGRARPFRRVEHPSDTSRAYFARKLTGAHAYFIHLKAGEREELVRASEPVYEIRTMAGRPTVLPYHDIAHVEESVGKLLDDFIRGFAGYLADCGIACRRNERAFTEYKPSEPALPGKAPLPIELLGPIYVYDNRLRRDRPLATYTDLFARLCPDVTFIPVDDLDEVAARGKAALIVQDVAKSDFEEDGLLAGRVDPYPALYARHSSVPKQTIGINPHPNDPMATTADEYLDYAPPANEEERTALARKLETSLCELYLKDTLIHGRSVMSRLYLMPREWVFIRKGRAAYGPYETLACVEGDAIRFLDLRDPEQLSRRDGLLAALGVDWEEVYGRLLRKHRLTDDPTGRDLNHCDVVIGPGIVAELEDLDERVLYKYDEIVRRQQDLDSPRPIEDLKLLPHYDIVRPRSLLSADTLRARGLPDGGAPADERERRSVEFYRRLRAFDAVLDEVGRTNWAISYHQLTQGELLDRIAHIFDLRAIGDGRYHRGALSKLYQRRGMFLSAKGNDVQAVYQGIWYDSDNAYLVGSAMAMKRGETRAHLIRRYDVLQGADRFDIRPLLDATSVQFVRQHQFTVYPYPFHLIDLYVENVLRYARPSSEGSPSDSHALP